LTILRTLRRPIARYTVSFLSLMIFATYSVAQKNTPVQQETETPAPRASAITREALRMVAANKKQAEADGKTASNDRNSAIVRGGLAYRGTPYVFGRTGGGAFDCSGFTQAVFKKQGIRIPRTAEEQYRLGKSVDKSDLRAGDMVFFKNTYKRGISHVGIYIGDGQFVHASSGKHSVTVSNLSGAYYQQHWAGAKRLTD
jgi:cell wall-associated NlpC family hydrolase